MLATENPRALLQWTVRSPGAQLMIHFADHGIEPTHQTLDEINEDYIPHLRSMLVAAGALPKQDKHVASFERWLARTLGPDTTTPNASSLRAFATWELLPRLRDHARNGTATSHHDKHISRVAILTTDKIETNEHGTTVRFGATPVELPSRVAELAEALARQPRRYPILSDTSPPWLFPGRQPGEHMIAHRLQSALKNHSSTCRPNRNGALIDLASELPAPIIADLLGLHPGTARRWSKLAKGDWTAYIGNHTVEQFPPE